MTLNSLTNQKKKIVFLNLARVFASLFSHPRIRVTINPGGNDIFNTTYIRLNSLLNPVGSKMNLVLVRCSSPVNGNGLPMDSQKKNIY